MRHSETISKLAAALAAFQADIKDPMRSGENPHFRSRYVQIDGLLDAVRPVMAQHGLSFIQSTGGDGQAVSVTTMVMHTSGEWIETDALVLKAVKADPQGAGSAITYGRRYSLSAALGVAWDDDDDGNAASGKPRVKAKKADNSLKAEAKESAIKSVMEQMIGLQIPVEMVKEIMRQKYGKNSSEQLTPEEAVDMANNFNRYALELEAHEAEMREAQA